MDPFFLYIGHARAHTRIKKLPSAKPQRGPNAAKTTRQQDSRPELWLDNNLGQYWYLTTLERLFRFSHVFWIQWYSLLQQPENCRTSSLKIIRAWWAWTNLVHPFYILFNGPKVFNTASIYFGSPDKAYLHFICSSLIQSASTCPYCSQSVSFLVLLPKSTYHSNKPGGFSPLMHSQIIGVNGVVVRGPYIN